MKYPEIVHAQYQDISREVQLSIQELLGENDISPFDVTKIRLIIGGDHGKGAFCYKGRQLREH